MIGLDFPRSVDFSYLLTNYLLPRGRGENVEQLDSTSGPRELIEDIKAKGANYTNVRKLLEPFREKSLVRIKQTLKSVYGQDLDRVEVLAGRKGIKPQRLPSVLAPIIYDMMPELEKTLEEKSLPELISQFARDKDKATGVRLAKLIQNRLNIRNDLSQAKVSSEDLMDAFYSISPSPESVNLKEMEVDESKLSEEDKKKPFAAQLRQQTQNEVDERLDKLNRDLNTKTAVVVFRYKKKNGETGGKIGYLPVKELLAGKTGQFEKAGIRDAMSTPRYLVISYPKIWWIINKGIEYAPVTVTLKETQGAEEEAPEYRINDSPLLFYNYAQMLKGARSQDQIGNLTVRRKYMLPKLPGRSISKNSPIFQSIAGKGISLNPTIQEILRNPIYLDTLLESSGLSEQRIKDIFTNVQGSNLTNRAIRINQDYKDEVVSLMENEDAIIEELKDEGFDELKPIDSQVEFSQGIGLDNYLLFLTDNLEIVSALKTYIREEVSSKAISDLLIEIPKQKTADKRNFAETLSPDFNTKTALHSLVLIGSQKNNAIRDLLTTKEDRTMTNRKFLRELKKVTLDFIEELKAGITEKLEDILAEPEHYKKVVNEDIFNILVRHGILLGGNESEVE